MIKKEGISYLEWALLIRHFEVDNNQNPTENGIIQINGLIEYHLLEKIKDEKTKNTFNICYADTRRTYGTGNIIQRVLDVPNHLFEMRKELDLEKADGYQPELITENLIKKNGDPNLQGIIMISHREVIKLLPEHIGKKFNFKDVLPIYDLNNCEAVYLGLNDKQYELWKPLPEKPHKIIQI